VFVRVRSMPLGVCVCTCLHACLLRALHSHVSVILRTCFMLCLRVCSMPSGVCVCTCLRAYAVTCSIVCVCVCVPLCMQIIEECFQNSSAMQSQTAGAGCGTDICGCGSGILPVCGVYLCVCMCA